MWGNRRDPNTITFVGRCLCQDDLKRIPGEDHKANMKSIYAAAGRPPPVKIYVNARRPLRRGFFEGGGRVFIPNRIVMGLVLLTSYRIVFNAQRKLLAVAATARER